MKPQTTVLVCLWLECDVKNRLYCTSLALIHFWYQHCFSATNGNKFCNIRDNKNVKEYTYTKINRRVRNRKKKKKYCENIVKQSSKWQFRVHTATEWIANSVSNIIFIFNVISCYCGICPCEPNNRASNGCTGSCLEIVKYKMEQNQKAILLVMVNHNYYHHFFP